MKMNNKRKYQGSIVTTKKKKTPNKTIKKLKEEVATVFWCSANERDSPPYLGSDTSGDEHSEPDLFPVSVRPAISDERPANNTIERYAGKNGQIVVFKGDTSVYISGACRMRVLHGSVDAFGYEFDAGTTAHDLFSLRGWSQIYLSRGSRTATNCELHEILREYEFDRDVIEEVCGGGLDSETVAICCSPVDAFSLKYVERCVSAIILPPPTDGFRVYFNKSPNEQVLKIGDDWCDLVDYREKRLKVMLCGGKGVGKSTLLRFMINKLLVYHEKVCVIDLDPGQSEFTMPGCISIVVVDKPVFGPNFTHQQQALRSILQNVDVSYAPQNYMEAVQELYKTYDVSESVPTLVNTMGFTRGLGLEIASGVIATINPKTIIEIKSGKPQKDFPRPLTKNAVYENCSAFVPTPDIELDYEHISIPASFEEDVSGFRPPGHLCRDIATISYFGNLLDESLSLKSGSIAMYKIDLDSVTVLDSEYNLIKPTNKAAAINANIVALCSASEKSDIYDSYGYGIVRGVRDNELYVITPAKDLMQKVTHLVVGIVQIPLSMLDDTARYSKPIPYFSVGCLADFMNVPRRSFLPRKST